MLGTHDMVPINITFAESATDGIGTIELLAEKTQDAINADSPALGELLVVEVVDVNGEDRLAIRVIETDADPFGFNNESFEPDVGGTITLTAAVVPSGDGASVYEFTTDISFLLSVDGAVPVLVTLPATDPAIEELGFAPAT